MNSDPPGAPANSAVAADPADSGFAQPRPSDLLTQVISGEALAWQGQVPDAAASDTSTPRSQVWQTLARGTKTISIAGGAGAAVAWATGASTYTALIIAGASVVAVAVLLVLVLAVTVPVFISSMSTNTKRQWAAASTLHTILAALTANAQKATSLVPPMRAPEPPQPQPALTTVHTRPARVHRRHRGNERHRRRVAGR